ncbi:MAG TPA: RcnB family protein [Xanthobacteraceae bacterium]|nr:RcnB family protein [Xanthobacteraceae bacterium]
MRKMILAAAAISLLAIPAAQAQPRPHAPKHGPHYVQPKKMQPQINRHVRPAPPRHHWTRGHRVPNWQRQTHVRDYNRYGLHRPGPGQRWVKVNNDYLLIGAATGIIAAIVAGR